MTKTGKILITIVVLFVAHFIYTFVRYGYSHDWDVICRQYMWIFKDPIKNELDVDPTSDYMYTLTADSSLVPKKNEMLIIVEGNIAKIKRLGVPTIPMPLSADDPYAQIILEANRRGYFTLDNMRDLSRSDSPYNNSQFRHVTICHSLYHKKDMLNIFFSTYINKIFYRILIWEFKNFKNFDLSEMAINRDIQLNNIKLWSGQIAESGGQGGAKSIMPISIKYNFEFKENMNINVNEFSKIDGTFSGPNYKGFYGTIDQMSFSNEKGQHQIIFGGDHFMDLFNFNPKPHEVSSVPMTLILYKGHQSFYVIIVYAAKPFKDSSIVDIFNLEP